jgi:predicted PurR-regulated permease PerM
MIPLVIYLSYKTGAMWMPGGGGSLIFNRGITFDSIKNNFQQYLYGSITLAFIAAIVSGILTWLLLSIFRKKTSTAV